ncbi:selenium metabolism-associated LysR family transcriptional regulator [Clostridium swellfunianum]|uniref:selenium metabolism-associated LysR family transcriptional regulator n=1 Tax=Clostridium swellfunianum TaxID=1367462 RepID=UPI00202E3010|nr:selenium metabolism-associated LysR family transcriptional regulator [Clostridium swellfunianum]MCM0647116.1 selenium metabolism-associated LysR family transcriptional regulator [Clostridium swellfunianum]
MDFKQIEAFITVAKYKSFSKAADAIFLSQPTISAQVSALEKELAVQLFDRSSKEVRLTSYGEAFLEYAIDIINTRNAAVYHMSSFTNNILGRFSLAASSTPCNSIVPMLVDRFSQKYPQVTFNITEMPSGDIIENILKFDCEIGLVGSKVSDDRINSYKLTEDELILISKPSLKIPDYVSIEALLKEQFIFRERHSATRKSFEKAMLETELDISRLNVCYEVNSLDTLLQLVKRGLGVSIVSKGVCEDYISSGNIKASKINDLDLRRYIYLITSSRRTLTPTARAFFDICKEVYSFNE